MSCCCGCLPPKDVYSGTIANDLDTEITVKVTYVSIGDRNTVVEEKIAPKASHFFEQKSFAADGCEFTYSIKKVEVVAGANTAAAEAPFKDVTSPVKGYKWTISGTASNIAIAQQKP